MLSNVLLVNCGHIFCVQVKLFRNCLILQKIYKFNSGELMGESVISFCSWRSNPTKSSWKEELCQISFYSVPAIKKKINQFGYCFETQA